MYELGGCLFPTSAYINYNCLMYADMIISSWFAQNSNLVNRAIAWCDTWWEFLYAINVVITCAQSYRLFNAIKYV